MAGAYLELVRLQLHRHGAFLKQIRQPLARTKLRDRDGLICGMVFESHVAFRSGRLETELHTCQPGRQLTEIAAVPAFDIW